MLNGKSSRSSNPFTKSIKRIQAFLVYSLYHRTLISLGILFGTAIVGVLSHQYFIQSNLMRSAALRDASRYTQALTEFRTLYSSEVVEPARAYGMEVTHDIEKMKNAIPLPATLSMELGERMTKRGAGGQVKLYSPYPFPWRENTGGLRDDFAKDAWRFLKQNPDKPYYRFEIFLGKPSIRYATADLMRESCVNCHNTHPDTPKSGWKEGDIRGVLEATTPLHLSEAERKSSLWQAFSLMVGMTFLGLITFGLVFSKLHQDEEQLRKYEQIITQTADHVLVTDKEGTIEYINPAFTKFTGFESDQAVGKRPNILKSGEYDQQFYADLWDIILAGKPFHGEILNKKKNGELYYEATTITPLKDGKGKITHFVSTAKDLTKRILAEQELEEHRNHLEDTVEKRTQELKKANVDLKEHQQDLIHAEQQRVMMESIGATLHHFSQPLTSLEISMESLLTKDQISEDEKNNLYTVYKRSTKQLNDIIQKFQEMREYRTTPYAAGKEILDIESGSQDN